MNYFGVGLVILGLAAAQILIGGATLLYSIPACCVVALAALTTGWPTRKASPAARAICLATALLLCSYLLLRNWFSPVDYLRRPDFFIVTGSLVVYLLVALFLERSKFRLILFFALLALALGHGVLGVMQFRRGDQYMLLPWMHRTDDLWRASGFYISPNHYAGLLEVVILLAISVVCWGNLRFVTKILVGYAAGFCVLGLALSGSRGGYLSFSFGFLVFVVLSLFTLRKVSSARFWPIALLAGGMLLTGAIACGWLIKQSSVLKERVGQINDPENMRLLLWRAALEQFHVNPAWGTGSGTYLYYGRMFRDPAVQNDPIFVHNDYLHLLAEYGVVGAAFFCLFFAVHVRAGLRNVDLLARSEVREVRANQLALQIGAVSAMAAYTIHSIVDFNLHIPANAFVMAWVFGMCANPVIPPRQEFKLAHPIRKTAHAALLLAGLGILLYGVPKWPGEWYASLARVALRDYHLEAARANAAKALQFEKRNPTAYYYAGEAAREMSAQGWKPEKALGEEAVTMFKAGLALFPDDMRLVLKLGQTYDQLRQFSLAEEQLNRAAELDPNSSFYNAYYGLHYQQQGMLEEAELQYERALELDGRNKIARAGLEAVRKRLQPFEKENPPPPDLPVEPSAEPSTPAASPPP